MGRNSARSSSQLHELGLSNGIVGDLRNALKIDSISQGEMLVLQELSFMGIRRRSGELFKPVYTTDDQGKQVFINAFEHWFLVKTSDTIEDIIQAFPQQSPVSIHWDHVSHNSKQIAERISNMNNTHLPRLVTDCRYISFQNGQYDLVKLLTIISFIRCICIIAF
jgi:hypothetical protein